MYLENAKQLRKILLCIDSNLKTKCNMMYPITLLMSFKNKFGIFSTSYKVKRSTLFAFTYLSLTHIHESLASYLLRKHAHAIFHGCKNVHFQMNFFIFFLFLLKTLIVGTR